jgi:subtilisin family serine protease
MSAPHVTGAIAVVQSAAQARLGRTLWPDEVRDLLVRTAAPMTGTDALWDFPCGEPLFVGCGADLNGTTGEPYAAWQVGAGALHVGAALDALTATTTARARASGAAGAARDHLFVMRTSRDSTVSLPALSSALMRMV